MGGVLTNARKACGADTEPDVTDVARRQIGIGECTDLLLQCRNELGRIIYCEQ